MLKEVATNIEKQGTFEQRVALCLCFLLCVSEPLALVFYTTQVDWDEPQRTAEVAQMKVVKHFDALFFDRVFGVVALSADEAKSLLFGDIDLSKKTEQCRSMLEQRIAGVEDAQKSAKGDMLLSAYDMLIENMNRMTLQF